MSVVCKEKYPVTYKVLKRLEHKKQDVAIWRAIWRHYGGMYQRLDEAYPWFYAFFDNKCWGICEAHNYFSGCGKSGAWCKEASGFDHKCIVCKKEHSHGMFSNTKSTRKCSVLEKFLGELEDQFGARSFNDVAECLVKLKPNVFE